MTARIREGYLYFHYSTVLQKQRILYFVPIANLSSSLLEEFLEPSVLAMFELRHPVMKAKYLHNPEVIFEFPRLFIHAIA